MSDHSRAIRVLVITSEWPTDAHPEWATFIVDQVESLRSNGLSVDVLPFRGGKNPLKYIFSWFQVRAKLDTGHYDLVHAHFGQSGLLALPKKIPLVVTFHGSDLQGYRRPGGGFAFGAKPLQAVSHFVASRADRSFVVSDHLQNYLPDQIEAITIPCGVDFGKFRSIEREAALDYLGLDHNTKYILFPANPNRVVKRYSLAEEVIEIVQQSFPKIKLLTLNGVAHNDVPYFLNACHAVLLTSYQEGSPTVIKEALACNSAVISVDVGDVREQIQGIQGCWVCEPDVNELATAVIDGLRSHEKIKSREAVRYLDLNVIAQRIIQEYQKLVNREGY